MRFDLTVIIVNWNTTNLLRACLGSLYEQTRGICFEVIVVDNASDDDPSTLRSQFPEVTFVVLADNIGFARANNLAACQAEGRYLLLLNPDTVVLSSAVQKLFAFARSHPDGGIFGGRTLFSNRSLNPASCWGNPTLWSVFSQGIGLAAVLRGTRLFDPESLGSWKRDSERFVDIVSGCFLMIDRPLWDRLGGFDPDFHVYGEDADLCMRAAKLGVRSVIFPEAEIIHYGGASERVRADKMVRLFRSKVHLFRIHWSRYAALLGRIGLDVWALTRYTACFLLYLTHEKWRAHFHTWREIWRRRAEWRCGWTGDVHVVTSRGSSDETSFGEIE